MKLLASLFLFVIAGSCIAQDFSSIDKKALEQDYSEDYQAVANALVDPYTDDVSKARAIYTWIANNIEYDFKRLEEFKKTGKRNKTQYSFTSEQERLDALDAIAEKSIKKTLKEKKGVCEDFSRIYKAMCEEVGLECVFITGFGRFSPNNIGKVHNRGNHAWNAVKINGEWELMDVTWSTGMGRKEDYGNGFFMVKPESFILSHYPDEETWQLLDTPVSKEVFANSAFPYYGFVKYQGELIEPSDGKVSKKGKLSVKLSIGNIQSVHFIRGKKPIKIKPKVDGDIYIFDLSKITIRGDATIAVSQGRKLEPVIGFKVK